MTESLLAMLGFLWAVAVVWGLGLTIRHTCGLVAPWRSIVSTDLLVGMTCIALLGTVQLVLGVTLTPLPIYLLFGLAALLAWRRRDSLMSVEDSCAYDLPTRLLLGLAISGVALLFWIARRDVLWWDGWAIWAFKAKVLGATGTLPASFLAVPGPYEYVHPRYPVGVPVLTWWFQWHVPSVVRHVPSLVGAWHHAVLVGLIWEVLRARVPRRIAALATAVLAWLDPVVSHAVGGTAEIVMAVAFVGAIDLLRHHQPSTLAYWRGGAALLLAALAKQEGFAFVVLVTVMVLMTWRSHRRTDPLRWGVILLAPLAAWSLWQLRVRGVAPAEALLGSDLTLPLLQARLGDVMTVAWTILWDGWWWPIGLLAALALGQRQRRGLTHVWPAWGVLLGYLIVVIVVYLITPLDHQWLLTTSFVRVTSAILPAMVTLSMLSLFDDPAT